MTTRTQDERFSENAIAERYDVVIVGGGPVGCVTAAALARTGASVLVLEADPKMAHRLAGEWLHPPALEVLDRLRLGRLDGAEPQTGYGFTIFPDDGSADIEMPYPEGTGAGAEHARIVDSIRAGLARMGNVTLVLRAKVASLELHGPEALVHVERKDGRAHVVRARRVVGADGSTSMVRAALGVPDASSLVSAMAGVLLEVPRLPREGFGHVILGGPGPALFYRIDGKHVRGCLEVPLADRAGARAPYLWERYGRVVPEVMREPLRRSLEERPILWAGVKFRPRAYFGREGSVPVALVGDACGRTHPLTAIGMTQGFLDAEALAESGFLGGEHGWLARYGHERGVAIPEILSNALYHCFRRSDAAATEVRRAMFKTLRESPRERARTMQILGVQDRHKRSFSSAFLRIALRAMKSTVTTTASEGRLGALPGRLWAFGEWMQWPTAAVVPGRVSSLYRAETTSETPLPPLFRALRGDKHTPDKGASPKHAGDKHGGGSHARDGRDSQRRDSSTDSVRASAPTEAERRVLERASARLLSELEAVARRLGTVPDAELAGPSLSLMRAITASPMRPGMAARMTLGRRRLATEGVARALRAEADTRTLAMLMIVLFDGAAWGEERVVDVEVAISSLLAAEAAGGAFANRRGESPDLETTAVVLEALAVLEGRVDSASLRTLGGVRSRAIAWIEARRAALATTADRGLAARALAAAGAVDDDIDWLARELARTLPADDDERAHVVHGLAVLSAGGSDAIAHADALASELEDASSLPWHTVAAMSLALARHVARRSTHPSERVVSDRAVSDRAVSDRAVSDRAVSDRAVSDRAVSDRASERGQPAEARGESADSAQPVPERGEARVSVVVRGEARRERSLVPDAADWAFCKEALEAVSRTFSQPIAFLPDELRVAVTLGYLLCRVADTIEDHPAVSRAAKPALFASFLDFIEASSTEPTGSVIDTTRLRALFAAIEAPPDDAELALSRRFDVAARVLMTLRAPVREILARWVSEMARGMDLYTRRRPGADGWSALYTVEDLDRYCYYVAGTVGHLLTELFVEAMGMEESSPLGLSLREDAESFAEGLQMVNILKDVTDDRERRVSFVPRTALAREGLDVEGLTAPEVRARAHAAVAPLFDRAEAHLDRALRYTLHIPPEQSGIRMFCLLPLFMAVRTLVVARGNDAMFVAGAPVKISRDEVGAIIADCLRHAGDDDVLRARYDALRARPGLERLRAQA